MFSNKKRVLFAFFTSILFVVISNAKARTESSAFKDGGSKPAKDFGVINKERIIYWLIKRGELHKSATEEEKAEALKKYIKNHQKYEQSNYIHEINGEKVINFTKTEKERLFHDKHHRRLNRSSVTTKHEVNVLTLLIDFPDLPHNNNQLTAKDTAMYYENYDTEHYQKLMFSETGFIGPNSEQLKSAHQYYLSESGGSFKFNGQVFGWLTADHNASYYGANNAYGNDQAATDLIKEAVDKAVAIYDINLADFDSVDPADLDSDGIIDEPDGYIDYIMVFHSSVGADAGGGILGQDAIWSHRWNVNNHTIAGSEFKAHGYTIQGIDSAIGVISHEFGHLLANLKDEYDTNNSVPNSPVGFWSLMSGGSWGGDNIPGAMPTGFSPSAKEVLQNNFGGNWVNSVELNLDTIKNNKQTIKIVEAVNHDSETNLVKVNVPNHRVIKAFGGDGFFHSGKGDNLTNYMSFALVVPNQENVSIEMKAYWDIEQDWDYARFMVNDEVVASNHSKATNEGTIAYTYMGLREHYLSGKSVNINHGWVDLSVDISDYAGQTITVSAEYISDSNTTGDGLFIDNITLSTESQNVIIDDAEGKSVIDFNGFIQRGNFVESNHDQQSYYIQLRSHNDVDEALNYASYDKGIVMWFADKEFSYNHSSLHPGKGFISVIDADQNLIEGETYGVWWSTNQIRDAVFSLYRQQEKSADHDLNAISTFNDVNSYINSKQPESGTKLPIRGLNMTVTNQEEDSSKAIIELSISDLDLTSSFSVNKKNKFDVHFENNSYGGEDWLAYEWNFGDGSAISFENNPQYSYKEVGTYTVVLTAFDSTGVVSEYSQLISTQGASFEYQTSALTATFTNHSSWGSETLSYLWDFGDGTQETTRSPEHTYQEEGEYLVSLTATTDTGENLVFTQLVIVKQVKPPLPQFSVETSLLSIKVNNQTTNGAGKLLYTWDFGDGSYKKVGTSPTHLYQSPGQYFVTLLVKDELGRESTLKQSVSVMEAKDKSRGGPVSLIGLVLLTMLLLTRKRHMSK